MLLNDKVVIVSGIGDGEPVATNAATYQVQGVVDAAAGPGAEIEIIAEAIALEIGVEPAYRPVERDGAARAARLIADLL